MKKVYEAPEAEVIDLMAQEQLALLKDKATRDIITEGSEKVEEDMFG